MGRLLLTSLRPAFSLQLWVAAPAALLGVAGCVIAVMADTPLGLFVALALLGLSTPVFGALFAIAAIACFPRGRYAQVLGSLLVPVGVGAALAPALPVVVVAHDLSFSLIWLVLGAMIAATAALLIAAEVTSHEVRG